MKDEIKIDKNAKSIFFINNGIRFSQFGIADEILDCITNLHQELQEANESITWWSNRFKAVEKENEKLKNIEYKFFDNSGDEESFTLEDYLELGNKVYDLEEENKQTKLLKERYQLEKEDYKSRIDKAIEYIYKLQKNDDIEIWREDDYWAYILNILNGGDE